VKRIFEAWITTDAGSLTTTVVSVEATSEQDAFRQIRDQYPGQVVRGVYEVDSDLDTPALSW
jgi:hypothetical protein